MGAMAMFEMASPGKSNDIDKKTKQFMTLSRGKPAST
jgi:hypothetical protein